MGYKSFLVYKNTLLLQSHKLWLRTFIAMIALKIKQFE